MGSNPASPTRIFFPGQSWYRDEPYPRSDVGLRSTIRFVNESNLGPSPLWQEFVKDFSGDANGTYRGYGISLLGHRRTIFSMAAYSVMRGIGSALAYLGVSLAARSQLLSKSGIVISRLLLNDPRAADLYSLFEYDFFSYPKGLVRRYRQAVGARLGISHHSLKCFFYLERLNQAIGSTVPCSTLEIGAGAFNFGHLWLTQVSGKQTYVVVDLPEVAQAAVRELRNKGLDEQGDYRIFDSTQLSDFLGSREPRKVLFATPAQLPEIRSLRFDLFVNHESFAEMRTKTVNSYLEFVEKSMKAEGIVFLVNREFRSQSNTLDSDDDPSEITKFEDYNLGWLRVILREVDSFRGSLGPHGDTPNVFFIGQKLT